MLEELLDIAKSVDFEDYGSLTLTRLEWSEEKSILYFDVADDYRPELPPHWQLVCSGVRDESLSFGHCYNFDIHNDHVLLWQYVKPQTSISFYGFAKDPLAVVGALYERHKEMAGDWIPLNRYLNAGMGLKNLIAGGFGRLAEGPAPLVLAYEEVLREYGISTSHVEPKLPVYWDSGKWAEEHANLSVLILDNSYVIASAFEASAI